MPSLHHIEYSKSSRAKCHGPAPCRGTAIEQGAFRYGKTIKTKWGEGVEWRHWGCVTPAILAQIAGYGMERVDGFHFLRTEDQKKVRTALATRRIDPADIPASAKLPSALPSSQTSSQPNPSASSNDKKRKTPHVTIEANSKGNAPAPNAPIPASQATGTQRAQAVANIPIDARWEEGVEDEAPEEEPRDELYCTKSTNVVGVQYYGGMVAAGEQILLVREPHNRYDRNAIQVKNIGQAQVGHIPRDIASKLAPLMDQRRVTVEGTMNEGNLRGFCYSLSVTLKIYGASDLRDQLEPLLVWATPGQRGFPKRQTAGQSATASASVSGPSGPQRGSGPAYPSPSQISRMSPQELTAQQKRIQQQQEAFAKAAELRQMLNNLEKVDDEGRRSSLLDTLCSTEDILSLPVHATPPGIANGELIVDLLKHQSQALRWCIDREYPTLPSKEEDKPVQFWQYRTTGAKPYYYNIVTKTPQEATPILGRGALCADSMGLGKTLTMIALVLATKADVQSDCSQSTLIVVPLSVLSNWEKQIQDHCAPGALTYCVYYGSTRSMSAQDLQKYDAVITTYQTVAGEHENFQSNAPETSELKGPNKKRKKLDSSLFGVHWKRVILDEGHNIRNPRTKMAKAVYAVAAQRRWVLTGTPIINSPQDLGSILTFLQICRPLDNPDFYKRLLLRPLKDGDPSGAELLRALMSQICIRRTKEMQDSEGNYLIPLPPVEMTVVPVSLSPEARELYDTVEQLSKQRIEGFMNRPEGIANVSISTNALSMLTRLRQLALHPGLIPADYVEQLRHADDEHSHATIQITSEVKIRLQSQLFQAIEDNEECPICFGILDEPRITVCSHRFCLACISEVMARDPKCPMDRRPLGMGDLIEPPPPTELTQAPVRSDEDEEDKGDIRSASSSAKIDQLVHLLKLTPLTEKSLVFSQFTSFLDKIAETLDEEGIPYVRFDGKMSARRRQETLEQFSIPIEESATSTQAAQPSQTASRPSRRRASTRMTQDVADEAFHDQGDDDGDFHPNGAQDDDGDDDFISDDDTVWTKKGKGKAKAKGKGKRATTMKSSVSTSVAYDSVISGAIPRVMLISLKAGALGLNLTVANNVYLMDPWWQEGIESQAIDRCNRIGQKKPVHVYQLIAEDTVESKVIDIQEKKKHLIKEAFSGMKNKETQRQKKEARLNDLIELFGIRQLAASQAV